ncbi:hypothetical protein CYMTET_21181 [Cymbomonas tetramitiformis]|uniref:Uncharacterized protein n=1 Tax=Cymbomonas tetramitiformis TaxID=36881 RepID=A0AAE0G2I7_9CHLO|nr:hypothetical protein CYMTET_21181 [Cymbomonas tetramitiformis]
MRLVCLAGQRRVTQPETAQRELLPHGGAPGALAVAAICHSRRALSPPKEKRHAHQPLQGGPMRLDTVHTLRATPGTMRLVCLAGQRRVTQPETAQRELLPHGGASGALAVAAICHSRRALSPPKEKRSAPGRFTLVGPEGRARVIGPLRRKL